MSEQGPSEDEEEREPTFLAINDEGDSLLINDDGDKLIVGYEEAPQEQAAAPAGVDASPTLRGEDREPLFVDSEGNELAYEEVLNPPIPNDAIARPEPVEVTTSIPQVEATGTQSGLGGKGQGQLMRIEPDGGEEGAAAGGEATGSVIQFGDIINSTVVIAQGESVSQHRIDAVVTKSESVELGRLLEQILHRLDRIEGDLTASDQQDIRAQCDTGLAQLKSPHPARVVMKYLVSVLGTLLISITGNAIWAEFGEEISSWVEILG